MKCVIQLLPVAAGHSVADVRIGLGYTGVQLETTEANVDYS